MSEGPRLHWRRSLLAAWTSVRLHDLVFGSLCIAVAIARATVLAKPYAPAGIDPGNWLAFGHAAIGRGVRDPSIVYPPLVPLLTLASTKLFGVVPGIIGFAVIAALAPAVAVYAVFRGNAGRWLAVAAAGLLLPAASIGEPAAWGGYPQLIGLGLLPLFLWRLDRFLVSVRPRDAVLAGIVLAAELATSHLIAAILAAAGAVLLVTRGLVEGRRLWRRPGELGLGVAIMVAPCLPLVPLYLKLTGTVLPAFGARPEDIRLPARAPDIAAAIESIYVEFPLLWRALLVLAVVTPVLLFNRRNSSLWHVSMATTVAAFVLVVWFREFRFVYLLPIVAVLGLGPWIDEVEVAPAPTPWIRRAAFAALAVLLAMQSVAGLRRFGDQRRFYTLLTPKTLVGITWLREHTDRGSLVAVPALRGLPLGWWVEGLGERPTLTASELRWLNFEDERRRARRGNALFQSVAFPNKGTLRRADDLGVDYLYVPKAWPRYKPAQLTKLRSEVPEAIPYENSEVLVLRVIRDSGEK